MLKVLVKNQLRMYLYGFLGKNRSSSKKKQSKGMGVFFVILMLYLVAYFTAMFGMFFTAMIGPLTKMGYDSLYFALAALMALALIILGSVFTTKVQLYDAKDNELLLALPIPPKYILASRMIMLLIYNLFFEAMVVGPAGVIYCMHAQVSVGGVICFLILFLLLPFFAFAVTSLVGWLIAMLTKNMRNKTMVTMIFSVVFFMVYFYACTRMNEIISSLTTVGITVAENIKNVYPLFWFGNAIVNKNMVHLLLATLCLVVPFAIMYWILSISFIKIATSKKSGPKIVYKEKAMKAGNIQSALLLNEVRHLGSSSVYMMNACMGLLFMVVAAVMLVVKKDTATQLIAQLQMAMPGMSQYFPLIAICVVSFFFSMVIITAPSISLEGKRLWIYRSIPVNTMDVINAKVKLHLVISLPVLFLLNIAIVYVLPMNLFDIVCLFVAPSLFTLFCADYGIISNLKHPRLDWSSEAQAVKQSMSVMLTMLIYFALSMTLAGISIGLVSAGLPTFAVELIFIAICALLCLWTRKWLKKKGVKLFEELEA